MTNAMADEAMLDGENEGADIDWVKHIEREDGRTTYCGDDASLDWWRFVSLRHAMDTVAQGSRLEPCEACMAAARMADATTEVAA